MELILAVGILSFGILIIAILYMIQMYIPATRDIEKEEIEKVKIEKGDLLKMQFNLLDQRAFQMPIEGSKQEDLKTNPIINTPYSVYTDSLIKSVKKGAYAQEYKPVKPVKPA
jgi:hypothetical protein